MTKKTTNQIVVLLALASFAGVANAVPRALDPDDRIGNEGAECYNAFGVSYWIRENSATNPLNTDIKSSYNIMDIPCTWACLAKKICRHAGFDGRNLYADVGKNGEFTLREGPTPEDKDKGDDAKAAEHVYIEKEYSEPIRTAAPGHHVIITVNLVEKTMRTVVNVKKADCYGNETKYSSDTATYQLYYDRTNYYFQRRQVVYVYSH